MNIDFSALSAEAVRAHKILKEDNQVTFKVGDKGKTREGDDYEVVAVLVTSRQNRDLRIVATVTHNETLLTSLFFPDGRYWHHPDPEETCMDLLSPKQKIEGFMAIYPKGTLLPVFVTHPGGHPIGPEERPIALIPISLEYEEGDGLG